MQSFPGRLHRAEIKSLRPPETGREILSFPVFPQELQILLHPRHALVIQADLRFELLLREPDPAGVMGMQEAEFCAQSRCENPF